MAMPVPLQALEIEAFLSRPPPEVIKVLARFTGDIMVLGMGGKMGASLGLMLHKGRLKAGNSGRIIGVSRFANPGIRNNLDKTGIQTISCDLCNRREVDSLPECSIVFFLAGQKFGTSSKPEETWATNTLVPTNVAERFKNARTIIFSTGCVYPLVSIKRNGSVETDPLKPVGEYANTCVGRERLFSFFSHKYNTPIAIMRLNYANEMRYGVLIDLALKVLRKETIDLTTGHVNLIWQRDAVARAIQCLEHASIPPFIINVTGPETISVRALGKRFGEIFSIAPKFSGKESSTALLSNTDKADRLFGKPETSLETMTNWVADYLLRGGNTLNKPTAYDARDGLF